MDTGNGTLGWWYNLPKNHHPKTVELDKYMRTIKDARSMYPYVEGDMFCDNEYHQGWQDAVEYIVRTIGIKV